MSFPSIASLLWAQSPGRLHWQVLHHPRAELGSRSRRAEALESASDMSFNPVHLIHYLPHPISVL